MVLDEPRVRGAARGTEFRRLAGRLFDRPGDKVAERPGREKERFAGNPDVQVVIAADFVQTLAQQGFDAGTRMQIVEPDVDPGLGPGRNDIGDRIADVNGGDDGARRLEMLGAVVQRPVQDRRQHLHQALDRVVGQMRIGGVAAGAQNGEESGHRPPAADLDHIAQRFGIGRFADQAGIQDLALFGQPFEHPDRAVDGLAFLVAGDQQADGPRKAVIPGFKKPRRGGGETGDRGFHVRRAAAVKPVALDLGGEGIDGPFVRVAHRHHVGVPGETEVGRLIADAGIEVLDLGRMVGGKGQPVTGETELVERRLQDVHGAFVGRRHGRTADQGLGKVDGVHDTAQSRSRSLMEVLERVFSSTCLTITAQ